MLIMINMTGLKRIYWVPVFRRESVREVSGFWYVEMKWLGVQASIYGRSMGNLLIRCQKIGSRTSNTDRVDLETVAAVSEERDRINGLPPGRADVRHFDKPVRIGEDDVWYWQFLGLNWFDFYVWQATGELSVEVIDARKKEGA